MEEINDTDSATVRLSGEYDIARREEIAELFQSISGREPLLLDMTDVTYVDSTFLNQLVGLRLADRERAITIDGAAEHIRRLLKTVSFDKLFVIRDPV